MLYRTLYSILVLVVSFLTTAAPQKHDSLRVATFNISLDSARSKGELYTLLVDGNHIPAQKSAEIIQRVRPDILLINEIDGHDNGKVLTLYHQAYLQKPWNKQPGITYPYLYQPDCNTGVTAGLNFRGLNEVRDNYGFGHYDGQYCMAILSKYPFKTSDVKSFQTFLWKDFPNALLPSENGKSWYSPEGLKHFRLSSKTHADVPVNVKGKQINLLISHPTPPVFDGEEDRNGRRNHDEIKFWEYYVTGQTEWLYDDNATESDRKSVSGITQNQRFIILGDLNASIVDGDATVVNELRAIESLLNSEKVMSGLSEKSKSRNIPKSAGASQNDSLNQHSAYHTAVWKMRADYVIPSAFGFELSDYGVFWPEENHPLRYLVDGEESELVGSDHRLVWVDLEMSE